MTLSAERSCAKPSADAFEAAARSVMARCDAIAQLTEEPGVVTRTYLSDAMYNLHTMMRTWMRDAGLTVRMDAAANIFGHHRGKSFLSKTFLLGSHLDTVRNAGKYDGVLGVLAAIAVIQLLDDHVFDFGIDVVGFADTEGVRFGRPHLGSMALTGALDRNWLELKDRQGTTLEEAIYNFGLRPEELPFAARRRESLAGCVELHVEQGPVLDQHNAPVGVVTAVSGLTRIDLRIVGQAGHAGVLPMNARKDALAGAADAILAVEACGQKMPGLVATVGEIRCVPNMSSVVPAEVSLVVDIRHEANAARIHAAEGILAAIQQMVRQRGLGLELLSRDETPAMPLDMDLTGRLIDVIAATGNPVRKLPSGASHDASVMAGFTPTAMLLIRTPGGAGHSPDERVKVEDVAVAIRVLYEFLFQLASA